MRAKFPVTVHLFFLRGDRILLLRRFNTGYRDGEYSVPAGHLDGDETIMAAAIREANEEIGLQLDAEHLIFSSVMHRMEDEERVDFFVRVQAWQDDPFNNEPDKCDDLIWADINSLPENTVPYVRKAIKNHLNGAVFDEFGWYNN